MGEAGFNEKDYVDIKVDVFSNLLFFSEDSGKKIWIGGYDVWQSASTTNRYILKLDKLHLCTNMNQLLQSHTQAFVLLKYYSQKSKPKCS